MKSDVTNKRITYVVCGVATAAASTTTSTTTITTTTTTATTTSVASSKAPCELPFHLSRPISTSDSFKKLFSSAKLLLRLPPTTAEISRQVATCLQWGRRVANGGQSTPLQISFRGLLQTFNLGVQPTLVKQCCLTVIGNTGIWERASSSHKVHSSKFRHTSIIFLPSQNSCPTYC